MGGELGSDKFYSPGNGELKNGRGSTDLFNFLSQDFDKVEEPGE